jgi:hypothetical protein
MQLTFAPQSNLRLKTSLVGWLAHVVSQVVRATLRGALGIGSDRCLWASNIRFPADASEFMYVHSIFRKALEQAAAESQRDDVARFIKFVIAEEWDTSYIEAASAQSRPGYKTSTFARYVTSFSRHGDQLSQWRAYCPEGSCAFGFRTSALRAIATHHRFELVECSYREDEQLAEATRFVADFVRQISVAQDTLELVMSRGKRFAVACWMDTRATARAS